MTSSTSSSPSSASSSTRPSHRLSAILFNRRIQTSFLFTLAVISAYYYLDVSKNRPTIFPAHYLPRSEPGHTGNFTTYLDARWPSSPPGCEKMTLNTDGSQLPPHIWLTIASKEYAFSVLPTLNGFVEQLNSERSAKYGRKTRQTVLIALCLDEECIEECARQGFYAYGGYRFNRPEEILPSTWPKLASMMEILQKRDVFFTDADVFFKLDPYPHMQPWMAKSDLVIQEEGNRLHFNTGWFWMRRGPLSVAAWKGVFDMDMIEVSRDQVNLNKILDSTARRIVGENQDQVATDFIAPSGLRVHVLDYKVFHTFHFEAMAMYESPDAVYLHATCIEEKLFMARYHGFGSDSQQYYSAPPKLLTVPELSGTVEEVTHMVRILFAAARYLGRAFQPPPACTFINLKNVTLDDGYVVTPRVSRRAYYSFPYERIGEALDVKVVEPEYPSHAARYLLGSSVLDNEHTRAGWKLTAREVEAATSLFQVTDFDIRQASSFIHLLVMLSGPEYINSPSIKLLNFEWPGDRRWEGWVVSGPVEAIVPCENLELDYFCGVTCGWKGLLPGQTTQTLEGLVAGEYDGAGKVKIRQDLAHFPIELLSSTFTTSLEMLDLGGNPRLNALPSAASLATLKNLKVLFLSDCGFTSFPDLSLCPVLEMVAFRGNGMQTIPEGHLPPQLRWLILTNNQITSLPTSIGSHSRLQKCMLAGNRLTTLPSAMANCKKLGLLRLSANQFKEIPSWLYDLPELAFLATSGNPCSTVFDATSAASELGSIGWEELEVKEVLGEGASGLISRAVWKPSSEEGVARASQDVALKVFKGDVTSDGSPLDEMNACIAAGAHSNLISPLARLHSHPSGKNGLVLQLIPSTYTNLGLPPTLQSCTRDAFPVGTAYSLDKVVSILRGIAGVSEHLHSKGITHGDLYAHNILIDKESGHALLGDFGGASIYGGGAGQAGNENAGKIERLEVLAFGNLVEDLMGLVEVPAGTSVVWEKLKVLLGECKKPVVGERPSFAEVCGILAQL